MHDGARFGVALAHAAAVTGDRWYRDLLLRELLPFYLKMLNHSDELFDPSRNDADQPVRSPGRAASWGRSANRDLFPTGGTTNCRSPSRC